MIRYAKGYINDAPTGVWRADFDAKAEEWRTSPLIDFVYKGQNSLVAVAENRVFYYRFLKFPAQPKKYQWIGFVKTM